MMPRTPGDTVVGNVIVTNYNDSGDFIALTAEQTAEAIAFLTYNDVRRP